MWLGVKMKDFWDVGRNGTGIDKYKKAFKKGQEKRYIEDEYADVIKVLDRDPFGEAIHVIVRYKGKKYDRIVHDGPTAVDDWDSMTPPPSQYRYVIINGKDILIEGARYRSPRAGEVTPYGTRDIYGGL